MIAQFAFESNCTGAKIGNVCSGLKAERNPCLEALRCTGATFRQRESAPNYYDDRSSLKCGLTLVRLVSTVEDLAGTKWGNRSRYDANWVYHGLLAGSPDDAVRFLHKLMFGGVLRPDLLAEATTPYPVGGPWPDRPWRKGGHFEHYLTRQGTIILKFFLHLSRKEQKKRFLESS